MLEHKFLKVPDDSPERCQHVFEYGQCQFQREPGNQYCKTHQSAHTHNGDSRQIKNYRLTKWRARVDEFSESQFIKSLREEIAVLRLCLEETLNKCQDTNDLLIYQAKISQLVLNIDKVVTSCHRLEGSLNLTVDKNMVLYIASSIVDIVSRHVNDPDIIDTIGSEVITLITAKEETNKELIT
jgi:hypothetical protein